MNSLMTGFGGSTMSHGGGISHGGRVELAAVLGAGRRFVTPADVIAELNIDAAAAAKRLSRWTSQGWLRRVKRGLYIPVPVDAANPFSWSEEALVVGNAVWSPCYFTGWTAANHWALTDQVFRTTVLKTTGRVRTSRARLLDYDYMVNHISSEGMKFGLTSEWREEVRLRIADPARTVIDILDVPRLGGGIRHGAEIVATFLDDHNADALIEYGDRLGNRAVFKRLGYIVEVLGRDRCGLLEACRRRISAGISPLDPDGPPGGRRFGDWALQVNVEIQSEEPA